jgi:hypothetical protein
MKLQRVFRLDSDAKLYRVCRLIWDCGTVGDGTGYSNKLSLALAPRVLSFRREWDGWIFIVAGIRIHRCWSYGGRFA